jgi:uncharacterized protein involved in response to NO
MPSLAREPYRLFFPCGLAASIAGVLLWPLYYHHLALQEAALNAGGIAPAAMAYPALAHARVMIEGFFCALVLGFLGTALPRVLGAKPMRWPELVVIFVPWLAAFLCHVRGIFDPLRSPVWLRCGDACFASAVLLLFVVLAPRFFRRTDVPPPGFPLALLGVGGGAIAAAVLAVAAPSLSFSWTTFLQLVLYQGFPLLPVLGIAPFLLPRFFGRPSAHLLPESFAPPAGWARLAWISLATGAAVIATFALEAFGHPVIGQALRAVIALDAFFKTTPAFRKSLTKASLATAIRVAMLSIAAGFIANALYPSTRTGNLHLTFVSGLALLALAVATRVILGHGGRHDLLGGKLVFIRWGIGLAILAATTRMSADYLPAIMVSHHKYAAWTWVAFALVWFVPLARYLLREDPDEATAPLPQPLPPVRKCPQPALPR